MIQNKRSVVTDGIDTVPKWGEYTLSNKERVLSEKEKYVVILVDDEFKEYTYEMPFYSWKMLSIGDEVTVKLNIFNKILSLEIDEKEIEVNEL